MEPEALQLEHVRERLRPAIANLKFLHLRVVFKLAKNSAGTPSHATCDRAMRELGFEEMSLGRVRFYVRQELSAKPSTGRSP